MSEFIHSDFAQRRKRNPVSYPDYDRQEQILKPLRLALIIVLLISQAACAIAYDELQSKPKEQCRTLISYRDQQECMQRYSSSYEQYEKQREKILQQEQAARSR